MLNMISRYANTLVAVTSGVIARLLVSGLYVSNVFFILDLVQMGPNLVVGYARINAEACDDDKIDQSGNFSRILHD
jgi:hypothetical protein